MKRYFYENIHCVAPECKRQAIQKSLCNLHYKRLRRNDNFNKKIKEEGKKKETIPAIIGMHKIRFGGLRDLVFKRDHYKCCNCRMSMEEHKERWGRQLTINHIDGNGRNSKNPNNKLSNLETLCLICHSKKDVPRIWAERRVIYSWQNLMLIKMQMVLTK